MGFLGGGSNRYTVSVLLDSHKKEQKIDTIEQLLML